MGSKRVNLKKEEDRINDLPDEIIHHILSFLPSTKEAIQTSILSKRWHKQWTHVPVLTFNPPGMSFVKFLVFTHETLILHEYSTIKKFHLDYRDGKDPQFVAKIHFATKKDVEEDLCLISDTNIYMLPEYFYNNASLVKLRTELYSFITPNIGKLNWGSLTTLSIVDCKLNDQTIEHILSGSPLLESFKLMECHEFDKLVIASKSMKRLVLRSPNPFSTNCRISLIQISCPKLEKFEIVGYLNATTFELLNSPSSRCATIDFVNHNSINTSKEIIGSLIKDILHQLRHVKELTIGRFVVERLRSLVKGGQFSQVLNIKCLTLHNLDPLSYNLYKDSGIICLLRNSPILKKLVINFPRYYEVPSGRAENDWNSNLNVLVPHLKIIKIVGFPKGSDNKYTCSTKVLNFIQFLLNNARALEKMVITLKGHETDFQSGLSEKLSCLTRSSQHAIIEVRDSEAKAGSNPNGNHKYKD